MNNMNEIQRFLYIVNNFQYLVNTDLKYSLNLGNSEQTLLDSTCIGCCYLREIEINVSVAKDLK